VLHVPFPCYLLCRAALIKGTGTLIDADK